MRVLGYICAYEQPSAILQLSGALQLINSSGAVGDVEVGAAYSYYYSWTEKLGITASCVRNRKERTFIVSRMRKLSVTELYNAMNTKGGVS